VFGRRFVLFNAKAHAVDQLLDLVIAYIPFWPLAPYRHRNIIPADCLASPIVKQHKQIEFLSRQAWFEPLIPDIYMTRLGVNGHLEGRKFRSRGLDCLGSGIQEHEKNVAAAYMYLITVLQEVFFVSYAPAV
jgi:hypothetical protein